MENKKKEIIEFKKERSFSQLLEAPFKFFTQEFKALIRTIARFAGIWIAVALMAASLFSSDLYQISLSGGNLKETSYIYIVIFSFFYSIGFLATTVATASYIALYVKKGKDNFSFEDVQQLVKKNIVKIFFAGLLIFIMVLVGLVFLYVPGIYLATATGFFAIIISFEDVSISESISRSFKVIKGNWWQTFGLTLVFGMMVGTMMYVLIIPVYVVIFSTAMSGTAISGGSVIVIILSVFLYFIAYVLYMSLIQVLFSFQYFNLVSRYEGLGLLERIALINTQKKESKTVEQKKDATKSWENLIEENNIKKSEDLEEGTEEQPKKDNNESNRFLGIDDSNRFKPKY